MALTDEEKRQLAQLEASLLADDPQLAHRLRGTGQRALPVQRMMGTALGLVVGLAMLVAGLQTNVLLSVLGFLVMLAACALAIGGGRPASGSTRAARVQQRRAPHHPAGGSSARNRTRRPGGDAEFMDRMEERWRRRQNGGR